MRKIAKTKHQSEIKQVILYQCAEGVYLFPCTALDDGFAQGDEWYDSLESAEEACRSEYGIGSEDWLIIPDPLAFCQHDWIEPVRFVGRDRGEPDWERLEKLLDGEWKEIELIESQWIFKSAS